MYNDFNFMRKKFRSIGDFLLKWGISGVQVICAILIAVNESGYIKLSFYVFAIIILLAALLPIYEKASSFFRDRANGVYKTIVRNLPITIKVFHLLNLNSATIESLQAAQRSILTEICGIIAQYDDRSPLDYNANVMRRLDIDPFLVNGTFDDTVYFTDSNRDPNEYKAILQVRIWAREPSAFIKNVAIPIDSDLEKLLCGGPMACEHSRIHVINDTHNEKELSALLHNQPQDIRNNIIKYFNSQEFRSFFCYRLEYEMEGETERLGVLTVQSNNIKVLGGRNFLDNEVLTCIEPYCKILAILIKKEDSVKESREKRKRQAISRRKNDERTTNN